MYICFWKQKKFLNLKIYFNLLKKFWVGFKSNFVWFETWNFKFRLKSENEFLYNLEILQENYFSCSTLKIFPKYLNFENISKKCIRVPGP